MNFQNAAPSPVELELSRMRDLQRQGRHREAAEKAQTLLGNFPENRDLLLSAAISLRHLTRIDDALAILDRLGQIQPRFSLLHEERGMCLVQKRDAAGAIENLLQAVNINPALPASWAMLEGLYRMVGDPQNAAIAAAHVKTLSALPPDVVKATSLFSDGDLAQAETLIRSFLLRHGDHPEAMRLLGKIGLANGVLDDAELLLSAVVKMVPDHRAARLELVQTLVERHKFIEAREQLAILRAADPQHAEAMTQAATIAVGLGEHPIAIALYHQLLTDAPGSWDVHLWLGHALKTIGQLPAAITAYRRAANARPDFGDAYWSLANLKTYRFSDDELLSIRAQEQRTQTNPVDRYHLCFALGKGFEDRGEEDSSWFYYAKGNELKRKESRYRPEIIEGNTARQKIVCTKAFFDTRTGWGVADRDPIFILGLPRSGSTLLEQILASHSQVDGTRELADIHRIVLELQGPAPDLDNPRYPGILPQMTAEDFLRLGKTYMRDTRVHRSGKPYFIDKMPNNFRHIGLIHLMLPNAKIIDARREPISCCFSNLKQLFAQGQEFTYSVDDIARYYRTYLDLMAHWDKVLPGRILRVQHEEVVEDLEGSVRRLLDYCELPFESGCIEFHKTARSVATPSSEQVRQPIFRDGLDQWKRFEAQLEPLKAALGDAVARYRE